VFEIGYSLRSARERQGIGLPEAELATKIRAKYIRALEEEDFEALPADTYARGFLRTYADYLGLDGEIYVEEYASRFHNADWEDEPRRAPRRSSNSRPRRERTIERRAVLLALAGIAVVTALTVSAWIWGGANSSYPGQGKQPKVAVLHGVGSGTSVTVWRGSQGGQLLFRGILRQGRTKQFTGSRFYVAARHRNGVRVTGSATVTFAGG
jgi:cytoskeletal protein RodZ